MGLRTLMELNGYLATEYEEYIEFCNLCEGITLSHISVCPNADCGATAHEHCAKRFYSKKNGNQNCTECGEQWILV